MSGQDDPNTAPGRAADDASRVQVIKEKRQKALTSGQEGGLGDSDLYKRDKAARLIQVR